eukprot:GHVP01036605.1.p1 GENE.GHVP01036605.1~~GHVP01036605.1.p1  ORF type:complete len:118 (-),score=11.46 GHVP01036605.1:690-1043(-)
MTQSLRLGSSCPPSGFTHSGEAVYDSYVYGYCYNVFLSDPMLRVRAAEKLGPKAHLSEVRLFFTELEREGLNLRQLRFLGNHSTMIQQLNVRLETEAAIHRFLLNESKKIHFDKKIY